MATVVAVVLGGLLLLTVGLQVLVRLRARSMEGRPLPALPGPVGARVQASERALLYFMSPGCGACRAWTPKLTELSQQRSDVFVVDVSQSLDIAMALGVMATPSAIEVEKGLVVGYHIGGVPKDVLTRFA